MGFFSKVGHAVSKAVKTVEHGVEDFARHPLESPKMIFEGVGDMLQGHFKEGFGEIYGGVKKGLDPFHVVGASHQLARPITDPVNKALAGGIKGLTGHNVFGSHPLNTAGTVAASIFTAGMAGAAIGGASMAGSLGAGVGALESAGASALGAVGSGLSNVGLSSLGATVSGYGSSLGAMATAAEAASGSIAGQMGLSGAQAIEMNVGSGLTKLGSGGTGFFSQMATKAGTSLTGSVSEELAAGTGHAMGSFGFANTAGGGSTFVQGTAQEVAKAGVKFGESGFFSSKGAGYVKDGIKAYNALNAANGQQQEDPLYAPMPEGADQYSPMNFGNSSNSNMNSLNYNQSDLSRPNLSLGNMANQFL